MKSQISIVHSHKQTNSTYIFKEISRIREFYLINLLFEHFSVSLWGVYVQVILSLICPIKLHHGLFKSIIITGLEDACRFKNLQLKFSLYLFVHKSQLMSKERNSLLTVKSQESIGADAKIKSPLRYSPRILTLCYGRHCLAVA